GTGSSSKRSSCSTRSGARRRQLRAGKGQRLLWPDSLQRTEAKAMDLTYISLEKKDRVAVAWMNKPKANTYDADLMKDLSRTIDAVRFDDDVDICVLASKLDGIWSAGADINLLASSTPDYKTMAFAKGLSYPQHSGRAVGFIKRSVTEGTEMPLYEGLALERELQNRLFAMADAKEGFRAFLEKRAPKFQGK